jgi:RNA polymerase sigma-70 factor (ECF subfamily)
MSCRRKLHELDPDALSEHLEVLHRVARRLCGSREDAEDLVQDTLAGVLKRPRWLHSGDARGYLLRALRNTQANQYRAAMSRPPTVPLLESDLDDHVSDAPPVDARDLMEAILSAPKPYRDAVLAVDVLGLSYRQAARRLRTREETITTRLHRGRRHVRPLILGAIAMGAES